MTLMKRYLRKWSHILITKTKGLKGLSQQQLQSLGQALKQPLMFLPKMNLEKFRNHSIIENIVTIGIMVGNAITITVNFCMRRPHIASMMADAIAPNVCLHTLNKMSLFQCRASPPPHFNQRTSWTPCGVPWVQQTSPWMTQWNQNNVQRSPWNQERQNQNYY